MAEFIPTAEEKAAHSYLDWDDAALGKFTKHCAVKFEALGETDEGLRKVTTASCAMILISDAFLANADKATVELEGHSHKDIPTGDWRITIEQIKAPTA